MERAKNRLFLNREHAGNETISIILIKIPAIFSSVSTKKRLEWFRLRSKPDTVQLVEIEDESIHS